MKKNLLLLSSLFFLFSCSNKKQYTTVRQLEALVGQTYMYSIIIALAALLLAYLVARSIPFQGGRITNDHIIRRIWFIVVGIVFTFSFFLFNILYTAGFIKLSSLYARYSFHNIIATILLLTIYSVVGIILMYVFRRSKWGTILGKSKK